MFEIGNSLREARLRQQLDFPEIEQSTKIRGKYLRALEEEQFHVLPAQTYVKGFLRNYAEYLGLDGELYVDEYNSRYVTGEEEPPAKPRQSPARTRHTRRLEARGIVMALAAIGILFALVIAAWKFGARAGDQKVPGVNTPRVTFDQQKQQQKKQNAASTTHRRVQRARLLLKAENGNCWLEVHRGSATGRQLYQGTLEQGQKQFFVAPRLWIKVGAPGNLFVRLNGRIVTLPAGGGTPQALLVTPKKITAAPSTV